MSTDHRKVLIIAGGSGTRLWPMSRRKLPKQFQLLFGNETPFQLMIRLTLTVVRPEQLYVIAVPEFKGIMLEQAPNLRARNILFEPAQRDTGPAVTFGILQIAERDPRAVVATMWSDHLVLDEQAFTQILEAGFSAAEKHPDHLVNVGTKPTKADPNLGYIHMGRAAGVFAGIQVHTVQSFIEKPDQKRAEQFFRSSEYLWNVGYNFMSASSFVIKLKALQPEHAKTVTKIEKLLADKRTMPSALIKAYKLLPKLSIDYLLVQKLSDILVIPADMGWSDIGTWVTLHEMMVAKSGNHLVTQGEVRSINTENSLVFAKDRPITLVGVRDLVVVDTGDTVLVMHHNAPSADLKSLVQDTLPETNPELL